MRELAPTPCFWSKAPLSAPTISNEKICCTTKLLLPSFAPSYQTGLIWGSKLKGQICCTSLFQEEAPRCVLKFACCDMMRLQLANQIGLFFSSTTHCKLNQVVSSFSSLVMPPCVLVWVLTRKRVWGACFRSKLPCVYRSLGLVLLRFNKKRVLEHHWGILCKSSL